MEMRASQVIKGALGGGAKKRGEKKKMEGGKKRGETSTPVVRCESWDELFVRQRKI